jgi:hypothetical protein
MINGLKQIGTSFKSQIFKHSLIREHPASSFLWLGVLFPAVFFALAKSLLVTYLITALAPASILVAHFLIKKVHWYRAKWIGLVSATLVTGGIALWNLTWLFPVFTTNPVIGTLLYPDYRSCRTAISKIRKTYPNLVQSTIYGWRRNVPFSWMLYLQEEEVSKAKDLWWKGKPYIATSLSRQEPYSIETIKELKDLSTPFLLYLYPRDTQAIKDLMNQWPSHLKKIELFQQPKGGTLIFVNSITSSAL